MRTPEEFDEIRPYDPEELPAIFEELIADQEFRAAAEQVLPEVPYEEACNRPRVAGPIWKCNKPSSIPCFTALLTDAATD